MQAKTEKKIQAIYANYINGNKKDAARSVRGLSKLELFSACSSHMILAMPELIGEKEKQCLFENFICNSLEGMYK
jgi:hypothetical protein